MAHVQTEEKVIKGYKTSILFLISTVHSIFYIQEKKTWPTSMLILEQVCLILTILTECECIPEDCSLYKTSIKLSLSFNQGCTGIYKESIYPHCTVVTTLCQMYTLVHVYTLHCYFTLFTPNFSIYTKFVNQSELNKYISFLAHLN